MKLISRFSVLFIFSAITSFFNCKSISPTYEAPSWITYPGYEEESPRNSWLVFHKEFDLDKLPENTSIKIGADTKYWLWVNGELIVREGGLKWGPTPISYYVDEVNLTGLQEGKNEVDILLWHFGKEAMTHKNSGQAGIKIEAENIPINSDSTWLTAIHTGFIDNENPPFPNWRLAESNILYDARKSEDQDMLGIRSQQYVPAIKFDRHNYLEETVRPIPQWKNYNLRTYQNTTNLPFTSKGDTLILKLPYNAQITPYFKCQSPAGMNIDIRTDNYKGGSEYNMRTNYITSEGVQEFETPGWINGHEVHYYFPPGVKVLDLKYRESGYNTEFVDAYQCSDVFYDSLWQKSIRTLYITMRDNFMDCPDRERAQWWGDAVIQSEQCYYAFDRKSDLLSKKAILELMNWQKPDNTIYSPVPAGNWDKELPTQMLASVGYYGIWNYYWHTGDEETIKEIYDRVKDYLDVWETDDNGLVVRRTGGWTWGDWGNHKDMDLIFNGWYYLALKGFANMAELLNQPNDMEEARSKMSQLKKSWNENFWNGSEYRSPDYKGETDERGHALAVISGIAPQAYYPKIKTVLENGNHCSPYFEKYLLEALFMMGYENTALDRMKRRYKLMVESPVTTLWEGWEVGSATWGGGTYNHSWSGGPLTLLSKYVTGIQCAAPGFSKIIIKPQLGDLTYSNATVITPLGEVKVQVTLKDGKTDVQYSAPESVEVEIK